MTMPTPKDGGPEEVAILRLPMSVRGMDLLQRGLAQVYNDKELIILTEHSHGPGWLVIARKSQ